MTDPAPRPFALHGGEKMFYDVRMGPVALQRDDRLYIAYQADPQGPAAHPHVMTYKPATQAWSGPVQIGTAPRYDQHFAPVLWFDHEDRLHALFNCHGKSGTHVIAKDPGSIERWEPGPEIAPSISYPHVLPMADGKLLLYYRTLGHMGHWGYQISEDGGHSWSKKRTLVDMDRDPQTPSDSWACSYQSVAASPDGRSLHVAFAYFDEQRRLNPLYNRRFTSRATANRYHLHYLKLDLTTGALLNADGEEMPAPLNREQAERCKIWDAGWRLTTTPAIWSDERGEPHFLLPVSDKSPWECRFHYVRRVDGQWKRTPVAPTNSTWCGALLGGEKDGALRAYIISGKDYGELLHYGGGDLEQWASTDGGETWRHEGNLDPEPGLIYNNPRAVELPTGGAVDDYILFFGWQGPGSLHQAAASRSPNPHTGKAYLWSNGAYL
jgi:hypothetical protein